MFSNGIAISGIIQQQFQVCRAGILPPNNFDFPSFYWMIENDPEQGGGAERLEEIRVETRSMRLVHIES